MHLFHHYHQNRFSRLAKSEFWLFESSVWMHTLARSLIAVFIPILLLRVGYEVEDAILYYVIYNLFDVPLNFFADWTIRRIGARKAIIIGTFFAILFFSGLGILPPQSWLFLTALALVSAIYDTFYWVGHLYLFVEAEKGRKDTGKDTGILFSIRKFASLLGPAVGALFLIIAGKEYLIVVSVAIFVASLIPLFQMKHVPDKPKAKKIVPFKKFFKEKIDRKNFISQGLWGIHGGAENVLWPLFIFVTFGNIESVALLPIIVSITAIIFSYFIGGLSNKRRENLIVIGGTLIALVWILRLFLESTLFFYGSVFLVGLFSLLVGIPISSGVFDRAKETEPLSSSTYRNAASMFAKFVMYGILTILVNVFHVSFILAALSMFLLISINYAFLHSQKKEATLADKEMASMTAK